MDFSQIASHFMDVISDLPSPVVYCTIVGILLSCGMGLPIPEDITLLLAGLLASSEKISFTGALIAGFSGVLCGDTVLFLLGRKFGRRIFSFPGIRRIFTPQRVLMAETRIRKNGPFICFIARFLPGLRSAIFAMSGALGVNFSTFLFLDGLAALLSVPLWVYVGYWAGNNFDDALVDAISLVEKLQRYIFATIVILILTYIGIRIWRRRKANRDAAKAPQLPQV